MTYSSNQVEEILRHILIAGCGITGEKQKRLLATNFSIHELTGFCIKAIRGREEKIQKLLEVQKRAAEKETTLRQGEYWTVQRRGKLMRIHLFHVGRNQTHE